MRKKIFIAAALVLILVILLVMVFVDRVKIAGDACGSVVYCYADKDIEAALSQADSDAIRKIFQHKMLTKDSPACGFSPEVSVRFDALSLVFCPACDGCGIIYLESADKYFTISPKNTQRLHSILGKYGFAFPCV